MDFLYEVLGDEKFQKFCQALLVGLFPNVQCLPVGQPDGGRDAVSRQEGGTLVFQVKYAKNPSAKSERLAISALISSERSKVARLIKGGATSYYLLTNVSGTSHLETGSIDKINAELTQAFGIPCYVWWRDDLDRRLEASRGLLWRYPELARGQDFLEFLTRERGEQRYGQTGRAFSAYMRTQHTKETDVKFQQVQIHSNLFDLFTDTPIGKLRAKPFARGALAMSESEYQAFELSLERGRHGYFEAGNEIMLAVSWLLSAAPKIGLQRLVLEGAPGQGKSTVTQYLCQIHRTAALRIEADRERIPPQYRDFTLRFPMRVDLRDYALWLTGKDPMASEKGISRPKESDDALESLIAYQIHKLSGGLQFDVADLSLLLKDTNCLLVLDGFDEVADAPTRTHLIEQIRFAGDRMAMDCLSLQLIVTSRPNAFILSPGFNERDFAHLALLPMRREQIEQYADKWISARGSTPMDGKAFKDLLLDRINRPHIRSLAQNPMQLAILLNLISTKGMSLPDKRTALYDSYMDLFFGREAEKDETVRENRDILLQIHQYVAWTLQLDAEVPGGTGSISQAALEKLVEQFLADKEHKGDVLRLFKGAIERVGALVSRVQGLLEFEVQPLREYFAGKFLYDTAPYSPPGAERKGTKPERFAALARRPYWSNVIRFYAGSYSPGELLSLVSGLEELNESGEFALRIHALQLGVMFLGDYVFAQEPRTVRKLIELMTAGHNLRYLLSYGAAWDEDRISLPDKCGRADLARAAFEKLSDASEGDFVFRLGSLLRLNSPYQDRWQFWSQLTCDRAKKLVFARALGLFQEADRRHISKLIDEFNSEGIDLLVDAGQWDLLNLDLRLQGLGYVLSSPAAPRSAKHEPSGSVRHDTALFRAYLLLNPYNYVLPFYNRDTSIPFDRTLARFGLAWPSSVIEDTSKLDENGLSDIIHSCHRVVQFPVAVWTSRLEPWSDLIESARRTWGDLPGLVTLAGIAAGIRSKEVRSSGFSDLLDPNLPLAERARHARLRSSVGWWVGHLQASMQLVDRFAVVILMLAWAPGAVLKGSLIEVSKALEEFSVDEWATCFFSVRAIVSVTASSRAPISGVYEKDLDTIQSSRFRLLLLLRLPRSLSRKVLNSFLDEAEISDPTAREYLTARLISEAIRDPKLWPALVSFYDRHPPGTEFDRAADTVPGERVFYDQAGRMPLAVAKSVVGNPAGFPIRMLELAEHSYSSKPNENTMGLGELSRTEGWTF